MKKLYFLGFAAALAMSACSSDNEPNTEHRQGGETYYLAFNIMQPSDAGTRADDFEAATDDENYAASATFFVFDGEGTTAVTGQTINIQATESDKSTYQAVLLIDGESTDPFASNTTKTVVCVLNKNVTGEKTLEQLKAEIESGTLPTNDVKGKMVMASSVYQNSDNAIVYGTKVTKAYTSEAEARANAADIYVERVCAKAKITNSLTSANNGAKIKIDGTETELEIEVKGISLANTNDKTNLLKSLDATKTSTYFASWNDETNHRSYWEEATTGVTQSNKKWSEITTETKAQYLYPNVEEDAPTSVLVTAQLKKKGSTDNLDLVYMRGGYTTKDGALAMVADKLYQQGYMFKTTVDGTTTYTAIKTSDLEFKNNNDFTSDADKVNDLKSWQCVAQLNSTAAAKTVVLYTNATETTPTKSVDTYLKELSGYYARVYTEGMCYYYKPITHKAAAGENAAVYGIVRNHCYDITLSGIGGIGVPVFDKDDVIIPGNGEDDPSDDETAYYLAAKINVLKWKKVSNEIKWE